MLLKKYKPGFTKVPWNIGTCAGVCDYWSPIHTCLYSARERCKKANYVIENKFYKTSSIIKEIQYLKHSYWIPKGHLIPKYKNYEN